MNTAVLIVDNEKTIRKGLVKALSKHYVTYEAFNGIEAMDVIRRHEDIRLVLSDLVMPGMDGMELVEELRAENNHIIVIIMTATPSCDTERDVLMSGADYYLQKPIDLSTFREFVLSRLRERVS